MTYLIVTNLLQRSSRVLNYLMSQGFDTQEFDYVLSRHLLVQGYFKTSITTNGTSESNLDMLVSQYLECNHRVIWTHT